MFVHDGDFGSQPALEDGAEKLLFAFEMAEKGDFVDARFSSDLARGRALNTVPGEGLGGGIQESFASLICGRTGRTACAGAEKRDVACKYLLASSRLMQVITCIFSLARFRL